MKAIFKRDFKSFFHNMTGPIFMAAIFVFMGIYFVAYNVIQGYPYLTAALSGMSFILLLTVPILTMRSFAEERKTKTDQLLLTSPVSVTQIVLGKYAAMVSVLGICMLISCILPVVIHFYGGGSLIADYSAIVGFFLLGAAYIAIGMFVSSLTESQIISAVGTFCILLILQLTDGIASILPSGAAGSYVCFFLLILAAAALLYAMTKNITIAGGFGVICEIILTILFFVKKSVFGGVFGDFITSLSLIVRFDSLLNLTMDFTVFLYYLSVAAVFCFLTVQMIQKRRWS